MGTTEPDINTFEAMAHPGSTESKSTDATVVTIASDTVSDTSKCTTANSSDTKAHEKKLLEIQKEFFLPESPDFIPLQPGQRLVVIGDIHGRHDVLLTCLTESGIIMAPNTDNEDESPTDWIAGNTVLVQVGDLLDRGYGEEKCFRLLAKLGRQAQKEGGRVVVLWGNHEVWNAERNFTCTNDESAFETTFGDLLDGLEGGIAWRDNFKQYPVRSRTFCPGGLLAEPFLSKLKMVVKIGNTVLVHGGLTVRHLQSFGGSIEAMNEGIKKWILDVDKVFFVKHPDRSALWMRDFSCSKNLCSKAEGMVDAVLQALDADRIVVGHTIQSNGVNSAHNERVWRVDIGDGYYDYAGVERTKQVAVEVTQDGAEIVYRKGEWRFH